MRYLQKTEKETKVKLDAKDRKMLAMLAADARSPASHIAKQVGLSQDAVRYRIGRYDEEGVIQGYRTVVNIGKFGFDAYHLFLQLNQPTKEVEGKLIALFKEYNFVRAVLKFNGKYDFEIAVVARNIKEFDRHLDRILHDCSEHVQSYEVLIISDGYVARAFPRSFAEAESPKKAAGEEEYRTDEDDHRILHELSEKGTAPYYEIARAVKMSHDTVRYRVQKMMKANIIQRFVPVINYSALSMSVYVVLLRLSGLDNEKNSTLRQLLNEDRNVLWAVKCVGPYNLLLYACVKDTEELHETLNGIRNHFPEKITDYQILIAYEEYKYTYFPDYVFI